MNTEMVDFILSFISVLMLGASNLMRIGWDSMAVIKEEKKVFFNLL